LRAAKNVVVTRESTRGERKQERDTDYPTHSPPLHSCAAQHAAQPTAIISY
jgi:hypothetical protein